jgi:hypothetical protein
MNQDRRCSPAVRGLDQRFLFVAQYGRLVFRHDRRQANGERRSFAGLTVNRDRSAHHLHEMLGDCKAKSGSTVFLCGGCLCLHERLEQSRHLLRVHADARVAYTEDHRRLTVV